MSSGVRSQEHSKRTAVSTHCPEKKAMGNGSRQEDSYNALRLELGDVRNIARDLSLCDQLYAFPSLCSL